MIGAALAPPFMREKERLKALHELHRLVHRQKLPHSETVDKPVHQTRTMSFYLEEGSDPSRR